jgi:hypothetical protein
MRRRAKQCLPRSVGRAAWVVVQWEPAGIDRRSDRVRGRPHIARSVPAVAIPGTERVVIVRLVQRLTWMNALTRPQVRIVPGQISVAERRRSVVGPRSVERRQIVSLRPNGIVRTLTNLRRKLSIRRTELRRAIRIPVLDCVIRGFRTSISTHSIVGWTGNSVVPKPTCPGLLPHPFQTY